ncbi:hypothetical protein [Paenibacillus alginolyticus]|nr:hypothetical protein [Paenibacillus alginolyticus]
MKLRFPWDSAAMIQFPWLLPSAMVLVALLLSLITWFRSRNKK